MEHENPFDLFSPIHLAWLYRQRDRKLQIAPRPAGCLVVPEKMSDEEFERMAFEQQRQFREGPYPTGEL